jgi:hypothetical protein
MVVGQSKNYFLPSFFAIYKEVRAYLCVGSLMCDENSMIAGIQ